MCDISLYTTAEPVLSNFFFLNILLYFKLSSLQKSEIWCKSCTGRAELLNYSGETWAGGAYDGIRKSYTGFSAGENVPWKDTNESDRKKKKKDNELLGLLKGKFN